MILGATFKGSAVKVADLPAGDDGIAATVAAMQAMVDHAAHDPRVRPKLAAALREAFTMAGGVPGSAAAAAAAVFAWCQRRVRFKRDPAGVELLRHPLDVLTAIEARGVARIDCDDLAVLGCCLLAVAGWRPVLVTVGRTAGGRFEHVFFGARTDAGGPLSRANVVPADPQEEAAAGVWPARARRVKLWGLTVSDFNE